MSKQSCKRCLNGVYLCPVGLALWRRYLDALPAERPEAAQAYHEHVEAHVETEATIASA